MSVSAFGVDHGSPISKRDGRGGHYIRDDVPSKKEVAAKVGLVSAFSAPLTAYAAAPPGEPELRLRGRRISANRARLAGAGASIAMNTAAGIAAREHLKRRNGVSKSSSLGRDLAWTGGALLGSAAIGGAIGSARGRDIERTARREGAMGEAQLGQAVGAARRKGGYEQVSPGVYAHHRKFGRANSERVLGEAVKQSKGHKGGDLYYRSGYVRPYQAAVFAEQSGKKDLYLDAAPKLGNSPKKRLRSRAVGTHEGQHVKDLGGRSYVKPMMDQSAKQALKEVPVRRGALGDVATGSAWRRARAFDRSNKRQMASFEGHADQAAAKKYQAPTHKLGIPYPLNSDPDFRAGYKKGGGDPRGPGTKRSTLREDSAKYRAALARERGRAD